MSAIDDVISYLEGLRQEAEEVVRDYARVGEVSYNSGYSQGDLDAVLDMLAFCKGVRDNG